MKTKQVTQELGNKQLTEVASQTSPPKGSLPQSSITATEKFQEVQTGNGLVPLLNPSNSCSNSIQESGKHKLTTLNGDNGIPPLTISTPHIDERLVRVEQTNQMNLLLTSTVVLKRKKKCCICLWTSRIA